MFPLILNQGLPICIILVTYKERKTKKRKKQRNKERMKEKTKKE
jgi:hypothetical protein